MHLDAEVEEGGDRYVVVNRQAARERRLGLRVRARLRIKVRFKVRVRVRVRAS